VPQGQASKRVVPLCRVGEVIPMLLEQQLYLLGLLQLVKIVLLQWLFQ
jgi:hypothetical protein